MDNKLIPAIIQEQGTGQVLMLAYMNEESLRRSIETGTTWFWSRSRKKLWNKGETSGNIQKIKEIKYDCDGDTLLVTVEQIGNACHTGNKSCFYRTLKKENIKELALKGESSKILEEIYGVLKQRIREKAPNSYTYSLHKKGLDEIIKKFGEESIEVVLSAKHQRKEDLIYEIGDLLYHLLLLLVEKKVSLEEIYNELESRRK